MLPLMSTVAISSSGSESSVSVSIRCGLPFSSSVNDSFFSPRTKRPCASVTTTGTCTAATSTVSFTSSPGVRRFATRRRPSLSVATARR